MTFVWQTCARRASVSLLRDTRALSRRHTCSTSTVILYIKQIWIHQNVKKAWRNFASQVKWFVYGQAEPQRLAICCDMCKRHAGNDQQQLINPCWTLQPPWPTDSYKIELVNSFICRGAHFACFRRNSDTDTDSKTVTGRSPVVEMQPQRNWRRSTGQITPKSLARDPSYQDHDQNPGPSNKAAQVTLTKSDRGSGFTELVHLEKWFKLVFQYFNLILKAKKPCNEAWNNAYTELWKSVVCV